MPQRPDASDVPVAARCEMAASAEGPDGRSVVGGQTGSIPGETSASLVQPAQISPSGEVGGPDAPAASADEPLSGPVDFTPPPIRVLVEGEQFGRYQILRSVGRGGMGMVYAAYDTEFDGNVAIKTLSPESAEKPRNLERFKHEAQAARRIDHPNVVKVFDRGVIDGIPYITMELLEGETLADRIRRGPLSVRETADVLLPVCDAIARAHRLRVIHRDLKPSNIVLVMEGGASVPKVLDFGVARTGDSKLTRAGALLGTPHYLSPEQAIDSAAVDERTDQYALGVIAYTCLTGRTPHQGADRAAVFESVIRGGIAAPSALRSDIPRKIDSAVLRATSRDPARRYPSVESFGQEFMEHASAAVRHSHLDRSRRPQDLGESAAEDSAAGAPHAPPLSAPAPAAREPAHRFAVPPQVRGAIRTLAPLLRRRGTSPQVGEALRRAVASLDRILIDELRSRRAEALEAAVSALRSCLAFVRYSERQADQEQVDGVTEAIRLLATLQATGDRPE
jgi:serine/threonine-protein kinase